MPRQKVISNRLSAERNKTIRRPDLPGGVFHNFDFRFDGGEVNTIPLIERLVDAGMDPESKWPVINATLLENAALDGHTGLVRKLIGLGARLKTPLDRNQALEDAVAHGRTEIANLLEAACAKR